MSRLITLLMWEKALSPHMQTQDAQGGTKLC